MKKTYCKCIKIEGSLYWLFFNLLIECELLIIVLIKEQCNLIFLTFLMLY